MRERLIQYVELLFAAAPNSTEIKQEILQNTLDRYDDLLAEGKTPEAAYQLAISGIGDINEILGNPAADGYSRSNTCQDTSLAHRSACPESESQAQKSKKRAIAIAMYILCPIPLFILSDYGLSTLGLCCTLALVAVATYLIMQGKKPGSPDPDDEETLPPKKRHAADIVRMIGLIVFLLLSFLTGAWHITWLVFPIAACVRGLLFAIMDLKEANDYEN